MEFTPSVGDPVVDLSCMVVVETKFSAKVFGVVVVVEHSYWSVADLHRPRRLSSSSLTQVAEDDCFVGVKLKAAAEAAHGPIGAWDAGAAVDSKAGSDQPRPSAPRLEVRALRGARCR